MAYHGDIAAIFNEITWSNILFEKFSWNSYTDGKEQCNRKEIPTKRLKRSRRIKKPKLDLRMKWFNFKDFQKPYHDNISWKEAKRRLQYFVRYFFTYLTHRTYYHFPQLVLRIRDTQKMYPNWCQMAVRTGRPTDPMLGFFKKILVFNETKDVSFYGNETANGSFHQLNQHRHQSKSYVDWGVTAELYWKPVWRLRFEFFS